MSEYVLDILKLGGALSLIQIVVVVMVLRGLVGARDKGLRGATAAVRNRGQEGSVTICMLFLEGLILLDETLWELVLGLWWWLGGGKGEVLA